MIFGECDTEAPAFYSEKRVKVRRPQMCRETGRAVMPGEHAWRIVGKWGRSVETIYQTDSAYHFARYLNINLNAGRCAVAFGEVSEAVGQLAYDDPRVGVALEAIWKDIIAGRREWTAEDKCPEAERFLETNP